MRVLPILTLFFLFSCNFMKSEERIYISSSGFRYKNIESQSPTDISEAVLKNGEAKILLVACPTSTIPMMVRLQLLLAADSSIVIHLVRDDCA